MHERIQGTYDAQHFDNLPEIAKDDKLHCEGIHFFKEIPLSALPTR